MTAGKKKKKNQRNFELLKSTTDHWIRVATLRPSSSTGRWPAGRRATGWLVRSPVDQWGHRSVDQGRVHLLVDQWSAGCCPSGRSLWDEMFPPWPHITEVHGWFLFIIIFFKDFSLRGCFQLHVKQAMSPSFQVYRDLLLYLSTCLTTPAKSTCDVSVSFVRKVSSRPFIV